MLKELHNPRQVTDELPRRWFSDEGMDLILWEQVDGEVFGFQLCYDKDRVECAITWKQGMGYKHSVVDDGMRVGKYKATPILTAPRAFDKDRVAQDFSARAEQLDEHIKKLVLEKISAFPDAESPGS
jgi:hypothetical protein